MLILAMYCFEAHAQDTLLMSIRKHVGEVFKTETVCKQHFDAFEKSSASDKNNLLLGYHGAVILGMARHDANVFRKMEYFKAGKEKLEKAISVDPKNVELRFLRLTIQTNMPSFLGYSENKEADKAFVISNLDTAPSEEFKKRVRGFIKHAEEQGKL